MTDKKRKLMGIIRRIQRKIFNNIYDDKNELSITDIRYLPRWVIIGIDTSLLLLSIWLAYTMVSSISGKFYDTLTIGYQYGLIFLTNFTFYFVFKTYSGIIRHSNFIDVVKLTLTSISSFALLAFINYLTFYITGNKVILMPWLIIFTVFSFCFMLTFRVVVKQTYNYVKSYFSRNTYKKKVVIYGSDSQAISIAEAINTESLQQFDFIGFISPDKNHKNISILGKPVFYYKNDLIEIVEKNNIEGILIVDESISQQEKNDLVDACFNLHINTYSVPKIEKLQKGEQVSHQIKNIDIDDLLNRSAIHLDDEFIKKDLTGKSILVTGGAGSIGSELVRQIAPYNPGLLVILDQAESQLHELELDLRNEFPNLNFISVLANISNAYRLKDIFSTYKFDMVYHAAAYKHVPLMENNPLEAVFVNIFGTYILSDFAIKNNVSKFVMISTDKAVNPTNVMGASKRAAEMYVQSLQQNDDVTTKFIITRFGNVLGSNGSVIPMFKKQIAMGGPVTVTHPDIIRYFMTISEACQLVLQAGTMGKGSEIFVFDMGKPVKIMDLAKRMIRLSGYMPEKDIKIEVTGLRPGEKLYEELLADTSINLPTHHEKILIAKDQPVDYDIIQEQIRILIKYASSGKDEKVVMQLKNIVAEYKSSNSRFEFLDFEKEKN